MLKVFRFLVVDRMIPCGIFLPFYAVEIKWKLTALTKDNIAGKLTYLAVLHDRPFKMMAPPRVRRGLCGCTIHSIATYLVKTGA